MRNDVYERMKIFVMQDIKPNYSALARQLQVDRRTVKRAYQRLLNGDDLNRPRYKQRPSKLDGFRDLIEEKVKVGCSARAIYGFIKTKGFSGKYTIVKEYCRKFKRASLQKVTTRVEHTIGLSAQVDWKEHMTLHNKNGVPYVISVFLYVMPYSKRKYLRLTLDQKQDTLFENLYHAFEYMGGVPKEIWFDNMSTVVDHTLSTYHHHRFNDRFLSFAHDANFKPIACRPFRPQTKGCVEALARTMNRLRPYDGEFTTLAELEKIVSNLCAELNHEKSQGHNLVPENVWQKEKEHLQPLNRDLNRYFESVTTRKVSQDSMVRFRNHQYSVNPNYIGKVVELKLAKSGKSLRIFYHGAEIRSHNLTDKEFVYNTADHRAILKLDLMAKRSDEDIDKYMHHDLSIYDNLHEE